MKVTLWFAVPASGAVLGLVKAKLPTTDAPAADADPPVRFDWERFCPFLMGLAVGLLARVGVAFETEKVVVTSVAALKLSSPTWLAAITTVPAPVSVTELPEMVAGPDFTLKVTGKLLDEDGAVTVNGASPKALVPMLVKDPIV